MSEGGSGITLKGKGQVRRVLKLFMNSFNRFLLVAGLSRFLDFLRRAR